MEAYQKLIKMEVENLKAYLEALERKGENPTEEDEVRCQINSVVKVKSMREWILWQREEGGDLPAIMHMLFERLYPDDGFLGDDFFGYCANG